MIIFNCFVAPRVEIRHLDKIQTCSLDTHVTICRNYYYHSTTLQSVHPSEVPLSLFRMTGSQVVLPGVATFPLYPWSERG